MFQKAAKKHLLKLTKHLKLSSFTNMITKIDVNDLQILEQMRLKVGKKLRTASFNSNCQNLLVLIKKKV